MTTSHAFRARHLVAARRLARRVPASVAYLLALAVASGCGVVGPGSPGPLVDVIDVDSGLEICSDWSAGAGARAFFVTFLNLETDTLDRLGGSITLTEVVYETSGGDAHVEVVLASVDSELGGDAAPMSWFYDDSSTAHGRLKATPLPVAVGLGGGAGLSTVGAVIETGLGEERLVDLSTLSIRYTVDGREFELPFERRIRLIEDRSDCD